MEVTPALRAWLGRNLIGTAEIRARLNVSRQRADQITSHRAFPAPVVSLVGGRVWLRQDVEAWLSERRPNLDEPDES
jgi:prophage regulatory protein